jgi:hypothetical protein
VDNTGTDFSGSLAMLGFWCAAGHSLAMPGG